MLPAGPPWTTKHSDEAELKTTAIPRRQDQQVLRPLSHGGEGSSLEKKNLNQPSPSVVTNAPHSCQVLVIEEAVCRGWGWGDMGAALPAQFSRKTKAAIKK